MKLTQLKQDKICIKAILDEKLGITNILHIERMGGMTNRSYRIMCANNKTITVRIPGEGTAEMICRADEKKSTELACHMGIDAELLYFGEDGIKIMHYIDNAETMSAGKLREEDKIEMVANIFRTLHSCNVDTGVRFEVFDIASNYESLLEKYHVAMYDDYLDVKETIMEIKDKTDAEGGNEKVPCHNDSLCENWVYGEGKLHLIDWEYAGMNDPMWDLADISIEAGYDEEQDLFLLNKYFLTEPNIFQMRRFVANKLYVDYLWTLWGKTRVPFDGEEMEEYALERYIRLKKNIAKFKKVK